jgi:NAD(P)-dependent dehydrogenase (short-subunit alcohol dehydrogenase family)
MYNPLSMHNKTILITGGSSGIGKQTAIALSKLGAKLVLIARNEKRLQEVCLQLHGDGHHYYSFDLEQVDAIPKLLKSIAAENGPLSGLFHSAGIAPYYSVGLYNKQRIDSIFQSSIYAGLMLVKGFCQKGVREETNRSSVVLMSSIAAIRGVRSHVVYSAGKAAINGAVRSLASELAAKDIRVNSIAAGLVQTELVENMGDELPSESLTNIHRKHLLGIGSAEDVANAAIYLLSDASRWVTGTTLIVDGGYSIE